MVGSAGIRGIDRGDKKRNGVRHGQTDRPEDPVILQLRKPVRDSPEPRHFIVIRISSITRIYYWVALLTIVAILNKSLCSQASSLALP